MKLKSILLGLSSLLALSASAQYSVTTGTSKYVLMEEATGTWCGYCPGGAVKIEQMKPTAPKLIVLSWHGPATYGEPMTVPGDPYCAGTSYDSSGFPSAVFDRMPYSGYFSQLTNTWTPAMNQRLADTAKFQVDMKCTYDTTTRILKVTVTGKALAAKTGNYNINAFLIEDSVSSTVYGQQSYYYNNASSPYYNMCASPCSSSGCGTCAIIPDSFFSHMHVVRDILGTNIWGTPKFTNPAINTVASVSYVDTLPATYNRKHLKVVGVVQRYGTTQYDRRIENAIEAEVRLMPKTPPAEVGALPSVDALELFPNPAQTSLNVKGTLAEPSDVSIVITNMVGQVVSESKYPAGSNLLNENISLDNLANGIYTLSVVTGKGEKVTRRFSVEK